MAFENTGALAFANALSNLGANIGQGLQERYKLDAMAAAVPDMQAGNWGSAGAKLMEIDPATGFKLIEKQRQTDEFNKLYGGGSLSALGAPTSGPMNLAGAILAQESGNNPNVGTSVDGARGIGQILPETFNRFAQPGENINNPSDNARVSNRILDTYMQKYGDPARAATAYFSGEGNVAPPGSPTPWKRDTHDGNNKYVSSYVSDIMNRMGGQQTAQAGNIMSDASPSLMAQYNRARWTIANPNMSDAAKEAAKLDLQNIQTMMREDRAANRPTEAQRNYNLARQQGFPGSFMDYQQANRASTTVNVGGEKAYDQTVNKGYAETMMDLQKSGRNASNVMNSLDVLEKAMASPDFYSGIGAETVMQARRAGAALGITDAESAAPNELFGKVANKLVMDSLGGNLGPGISNTDVRYISETVPNMANTKEGNKQVIAVQRKIEQRKIEVARMARDYAKKNGRLDAGFDEQIAQFAEQNPLFREAAPQQPARETQQPQAEAGLIPEPPQGVTADQISQQAAAKIAANPAMRDAIVRQMMLWKKRIPGLAIP